MRRTWGGEGGGGGWVVQRQAPDRTPGTRLFIYSELSRGKERRAGSQAGESAPWTLELGRQKARSRRVGGRWKWEDGVVGPGAAPVPVGELALAGGRQQDVVNLILDAEGVRRGGLVLGARVGAHVGVLQPHLGGQAIHGVKGQDLLQKVDGCGEQSRAGWSLVPLPR